MTDLYHHYLRAWRRDLDVDEIKPGVFAVSSHSNPDDWHRVEWGNKGLPTCDCKATGACSHGAAVIAYVRSDIRREWEDRRVRGFYQRLLDIRLGRVNPRRFPKVRKVMDELEARFSSAVKEETESVSF